MDLEQFIEEQRARFEVPGIAVAIVRDGEIVLRRGFGVRELGTERLVTADTLFAIGSSSKAFTAAICGALVDDGLLGWDVPIREYLPWFRMYDAVASEQVTVRDLLSHRTGLPRHDFVWYGDPPVTRAELVARLRHLPPSKGFRQVMQYNNLCFTTAGYLAGELLGGSWEQAVRKRLLDPLGMRSTNFSVADSQRTTDFSLPHDERDGGFGVVPFRSIDIVGPAGSINSSITDMAAFLSANVNGGSFAGQAVMSPATIRELHTAQMVLPIDSLFAEVSDDAYGLGWFISTYRGHRVVHHGGNIDGFTALVSLAPEARAGIVVLANRGTTGLPKLLSYALYDEVFGLEPLDWSARFAGAMDAMKAGAKEARAHRRASYAPDTKPSHALADYAGDYTHPGYGTISIALSPDGASLAPAYNGLDLTMSHRHYDVFEMALSGREDITIPVVFATDSDGDVASASIQIESAVPPLTFERAPDPMLRDPEHLARLHGVYEMGPIVARVELQGEGTLVLSMPMLPATALDPHLGKRFRLRDLPAARAEFVLDDAGNATSLVIAGVGTFARKDG